MVLTNRRTLFNKPLDESDVPVDGDVIKFDGATDKFIVSPGSSSSLALDDLTDVTVSAPTAGQYLRKGAGDWTNADIQASDLPSHNHTKSQITDFAHQSTHQSGGSDALTGNLDATARTTVRKNSGGADVGSRRRLNFIEGTNVTITAADDPTDEEIDITISSAGGGGGVTDGDKGDITVSGGGTTWTIDNDVVTFAKMQNIATDRLLGRDTAASGDPEEITVGGGLEFTGTGGIQTSALSGDVTKAAGGTTTTISNNAVTDAKLRDSAALSVIGRASNTTGDPADISAAANDILLRRVSDALDFGQLTIGMFPNDLVTYAKIQNVSATSRFLGRITAGAGDIEELTGTQATSLLDVFTSTLKGLVPASGGGTTNFLRADGTWAAPSGGGGGTIPVSYTFVGGATTWTNKPSALTELIGNVNRRQTIDLTNATQFRIILDVQTAGVNSSSVIGVQYSTDGGTTWNGLDNGTAGSNSTVTLADNPTGSKVSAWTNLAASAKADVLVRIAGSGGDGVADPVYNIIAVQFK